MILNRHFHPPDLVTATLGGIVTAEDQIELLRFLRTAIATAGTVRVLLRLDGFAGWKPDTRFEHHSLWLHDDEGVSKIGIFGDPEWKPAMLTLMAQPVRRVPIAYFATEAAARRWLEPSRVAARAASS